MKGRERTKSLISQKKRAKEWYREVRKDYAAKRGESLRQRQRSKLDPWEFRIVTYHMRHIHPSRPGTARTPRTVSSLFIMAPVPSRAAILRLINASRHTSCPCHGSHVSHNAHAIANQLRRLAIPVDKVEKEYAFEVFCAFLTLIVIVIIST